MRNASGMLGFTDGVNFYANDSRRYRCFRFWDRFATPGDCAITDAGGRFSLSVLYLGTRTQLIATLPVVGFASPPVLIKSVSSPIKDIKLTIPRQK